MSKRLDGKVAWVTGSSRGIGRVVADHLAGLGAKVAIHGTTPHSTRAFNEAESLDAVAAEVAGRHDADVLAVHGDLTDEQTVKDLTAQIRDRFGRIDILINNAGGDIGAQGTMGAKAGKPVYNDAVNVSLEDIRTVGHSARKGTRPQPDDLHPGMPRSGTRDDGSKQRLDRHHR